MPAILDESQILEMKALHRTLEDKKQADKIKMVVMWNRGFTAKQIAEALIIEETTVRRNVNRYRRHGLEKYLESLYKGSVSKLDEKKREKIKTHFTTNTPQTASEVVAYIKKKYDVSYSIIGVNKLMHRLGFVYKKPKIMPGKADLVKQAEFVTEYLNLKSGLDKDDQIYFADATHPTHNTKATYGWILKGKKNDKYLKSNTGRARINLNGAINLQNQQAVVLEEETVNSQSVIRLLEKIDQVQKQGKVSIVLDNARYHHANIVKDWLAKHQRFKFVYLPSYSPNLNPIERLWRFYHTKVTNNQYFESFKDFKKATLEFFETLKQHEQELKTLLTDNFQTFPNLNADSG